MYLSCGENIMSEMKETSCEFDLQIYKSILKATRDFVFVKDRKLVYCGASDSFARLVGLESGEQVVGKNDFDLFPEELAEQYRTDDFAAMASEKPLKPKVEKLPEINGENRWAETTKQRLVDSDGNVVGVYALSRDITRIVELENEKGRLKKITDRQESIQEAIIYSDVQFFTYYPQEGKCEIYDNCKRFVGFPAVWENFPDDFIEFAKLSVQDKAAYLKMIQAINDGEDEASCIVKFDMKENPTWEKVTIRALRDELGNTVRGLGYTINVTATKEAEERIQKERVRSKAMEGNVFEAFSFNLTKNQALEVQSRDEGYNKAVITDEILQATFESEPLLKKANRETLIIFLKAVSRIPDAKDREQFVKMIGVNSIIEAKKLGRYSGKMSYRRIVNGEMRWVVSTSEVMPDPDSGDLIAFYYTMDVNDQVINEMINSQIISEDYLAVSYLNLTTGILKNRETPWLAGYLESMTSLDGALTMLKARLSDQPENEGVLEKLSLDNIVAELKKSEEYIVFYSIEPGENGSNVRHIKHEMYYLDDHKDVIVFLLTDVTDVVKRDQENKERMSAALVAAEQASAAKSNFLSRMSHEIRTPLNAIIGMDTIAAQSIGNPGKTADCISKIGISARYLLSLINDILDMSRIESGKMLLKNEKFMFRDLIGNVDMMIYNQTRAKGLDYECVVSNEVAEAYIGDAMKLQQVLINILGNAVKFTEKGKVSMDIHQINCRGKRSMLRFTVNDTGIGISEEFMDRIFEPFSQSDTTTTSVFGGTGLGLAITKSLVSLMGGSINVRSIIGVGSEFTVDVPLTVDESVLRQPKIEMHFDKMHTLIVDDDLLVCEQTADVLRDIGMIGEWVTSGSAAIERVRTKYEHLQAFDFILIDWLMPDMDGIETTRQIRKIVGPDVTIIIITAYDWEPIEHEAKAAGANLLVTKPLLKTTLISAFQKAMGQTEEEEIPQDQFDFRGKRLLVAEDNQLNAEIAKTLLENKNFEVEVVANGLKAIEQFIKMPAHYYDAILMDIRMPLMDGLQATTNIRHCDKEDAKTIPIIAMTANAFDEDVEKSKAFGMDAHLSKPIDPYLMYSTLYRMLAMDDDVAR